MFQVLLHPVELDCGHVFCFLCVKGVTLQGLHRAAVAAQARPNAQQPQPRGSGASCPMCRAPIQPHTLLNPNLIDTPISSASTTQDAVAADPSGHTHDHHSQGQFLSTFNLTKQTNISYQIELNM